MKVWEKISLFLCKKVRKPQDRFKFVRKELNLQGKEKNVFRVCVCVCVWALCCVL